MPDIQWEHSNEYPSRRFLPQENYKAFAGRGNLIGAVVKHKSIPNPEKPWRAYLYPGKTLKNTVSLGSYEDAETAKYALEKEYEQRKAEF